MLIYTILGVLFMGVLNRLRGGAFATLLHINIGTQLTRLLTSALMGGFLCLGAYTGIFHAVSYITYIKIMSLIISLTAGYIIAGWAPFQGMNNTQGDNATEKSYLEIIPNLLFTPQTIAWKVAGMSLAGFVCLLPATTTYALLFNFNFKAILFALIGLLFGPAYYLASKLSLPINNFTNEKMTYGEVFAGFVIGLSLILCLSFTL
jgi:hypothetical protein